jgi:hypothetical protein
MNKWQEDRNSGVNKILDNKERAREWAYLNKTDRRKRKLMSNLTKMAESVMLLLIMPEKMKKNRNFDYALPVF